MRLKIITSLLFLYLFLPSNTWAQTYHDLSLGPLSQDWSDNGLIMSNGDWSSLPSIRGFLGTGLTFVEAVDPQTVLNEENTVNVLANQLNSGIVTGGLAEFEDDDNDNLTTFNPVIALQGSTTADAPHLMLYLNTTGSSNIQISYNLRELDNDNAVQAIALQYRIGTTGSFINIPAGYVTDASNGGALVTNVDITLPAALENQAQVQVRIITTNASGSDSWIGIDDIQVVGIGAGNDNDSDVINPGTQIPATSIASTNDTAGEAVEVFSFVIEDQGSGDGLATLPTNLRLIPAPSNTADWSDHIQGFTLNNGGNISSGSPTISDSEINIPITSGDLLVTDGGSTELTLAVYLNTSSISDGAILSFQIDADAHGFIADGAGSTFIGTFSEGDIISNDFTIQVRASDFRFNNLFPLEANTNESFSLSIEAIDENGNLDSDNNASVSLSKSSGSGSLTVSSPQSFSGGSLSFNDVQLDAADTYILALSATGFNSLISGDIIVSTPLNGDFRSRNASGNWSTITDWETFDGANWILAGTSPSSSNGKISIQNGHTMTLDIPVSVDQLVIARGGILERGGGALLSLADGSGDDMTIRGTFRILSTGAGDNYSNTISYAGNSKILVAGTGVLEINISGGAEHYTYATEPISRVEFQDGATFHWNPLTSAAFASTNITYFPSVAASTQPVFRVSNSIVIGSSDPTVINGILEIDEGVNLSMQNTGSKTFRNGIRGEGTLSQLATSGAFIINGSQAELSLDRIQLNAGLQINNADTTQLLDQVEIEGGQLSLLDGKLNLNGHNLLLGDNAQILEDALNGHIADDFSASDESGTGGYIEATNYNPGGTPENIGGLGILISNASINSLRRFHYRADLGRGIPRVYVISGTPSNAQITFEYDADNLGGIVEADLRVFRFGPSNIWEEYNTGFSADLVNDAITVDGVTEFSTWTLGDINNPLPVQLVQFQAEQSNESEVKLNWETRSEFNNAGFDLGKSRDGNNFQSLAWIDGKANRSERQVYEYVDKQFEQSAYYQLTQVDLDGRRTKSQVVFVPKNGEVELKLYPNPVAQDQLNIRLNGSSQENLFYSVLSPFGKALGEGRGKINEIQDQIREFLADYAAGTYILLIRDKNRVFRKRFVKL